MPTKQTPNNEQQPTTQTRKKKENAWVDDENTEEENPNAAFLAAMNVARQAGGTQKHQPQPPTKPESDNEEEEPTESRSHLVKHRAPRAEAEEEMFENVYRRDTYYIDRSYMQKLKQLIHDSKQTKTHLMNEALQLLFEKYEIE